MHVKTNQKHSFENLPYCKNFNEMTTAHRLHHQPNGRPVASAARKTLAEEANPRADVFSIFSFITRVFSFGTSLPRRTDESAFSHISLSGQKLIDESEALKEKTRGVNEQKIGFNLTKKQALVFGSLLLGAGFAGVVYYRNNHSPQKQHSDKNNYHNDRGIYLDIKNSSEYPYEMNDDDFVNPSIYTDKTIIGIPDPVTGLWQISEEEFYNDISVINQLVVSSFDDGYVVDHANAPPDRVARQSRRVIIKNKNILSEIINLTRDEKIDRHLRNEFHHIFRRSESSPDVKKIENKRERNIRLLLKCIQYTHKYIYGAFANEINNLSFFLANIHLVKLWRIVESLSKKDKRTVRVLIKEHNAMFKGKTHHFSFLENNHKRKRTNKKRPGVDGKVDPYLSVNKNKNGSVERGFSFNANRRSQVMYDIKKRIYSPKEREKNQSATIDDVVRVKTTDCHDQREALSVSKILRVISKTVKSPVTSLIEEGRVILHYEIYGMGCTNYTNFNALSQKIETALGGLFTWLPTYNKTRLVTLIFATVLDMISDSIDNKELSIDYLEDLENYTLSLAKDIVSSLLTKTVNEIANNNDDKRISSIVKNIKHKNNNLIIKTQRPEKTVYIDRVANHFADEESKGLIFYNEHNCWVIDKNLPFNNEVKSTFNLAENFWTNAKNIYFYKNSSPEIYGDGILIRFDGMAYALVGNVFKPALEIQISDNVFRYMAKDDRGYRPITQRAGKWVFESEHTPLASEALISLIESDQKLKNELVSMDIQHHNVGPITAGRKYQFDKYHNKYLKISDEYFRFHVDDSMTMYLEGKGDLLPLTYSGGKFVIKPDLVTGIYSIIKYPLERLPWETYDQDYYIDNTIVNEINKHKILLSAKDSQTISQLAMHALTPSKSIDGAVICEAKEYLPYEDRLISIKANGDDTYILGELTGEEEGIHLYKNQKSNSYYLMPQGAGINSGRQRYKLRSSMCRTKRQIFSLCTADFYESNDISFLLKRNVGAGLKFDSPSEILKPYVGINGFYKDIKLDSKLYYLSNNDVFFHALESPVSDNAIPTYFKLYGKNNDGEINPNFLITDVSIVKDFGTKKIIITTPSEAQEMIFSLDRDLADKSVKWQSGNSRGHDFNIDGSDLSGLPFKLYNNENMHEVYNLLERSGKKVVTSVQQADLYIEEKKTVLFRDPEQYAYKSLDVIEKEHQYTAVSTIMLQAFDKTKATLSSASYLISNDYSEFDEYMLNKLRITDKKVRDYVSEIFCDKINKMKLVFGDEAKDNIIIAVKKRESGMDEARAESNILGFSYVNDPLDRIFINAEFIPADYTPDEREYEGYTEQQYYVNLAADTMRHEAVHALGSPDDYFYLRTDAEGNLEDVDASIARIEYHIITGKMLSERFVYLCKVYFMTNPVYKAYNLDSLLKPSTLYHIFQRDNYLRMIFLVNNPDTLSLIIRDLAKLTKFPQ